GLLWNPDNPWHPLVVEALRDKKQSVGLLVQMLEIRSPEGFENAFHEMRKERAGASLVLADPMTFTHRRRLAELAINERLPLMGALRGYAEAGCLLSYWAEEVELFRRVARYVDKILRGAKPADLPVEQPTKFELVINLKTAKALGVTIPPS